MAALQSSMTSLSLSSNSFLGQRLSPPTLYPVTVPYPTNPLTFFVFSILLCFVAFKLVVHCYMKFHHDFLLKLQFFVGHIIMGVSQLGAFSQFFFCTVFLLARCMLVIEVAIMSFPLMFSFFTGNSLMGFSQVRDFCTTQICCTLWLLTNYVMVVEVTVWRYTHC